MKKINFLAAFAAAAAVLSCNPDDKPNNQKPEDVKFSLSEDNIKVSGLEKEYVVKVKKDISDDFLSKMANGIYLKELEQTTRPCRIEAVGKRTFRIVLTQGLNRQIRRMCEASGQEVLSLKRVRVANVELGKLKPGEYRLVSGEELSMLYAEAGIQA